MNWVILGLGLFSFNLQSELISLDFLLSQIAACLSVVWIYDYLAKHAPPQINQKKQLDKDNEQYDSHTNPCTIYVRISYQHQLSVPKSAMSNPWPSWRFSL